MIRRLGVLLVLATLVGAVLSLVGALWGWILGRVLPPQPPYPKAAFYGLVQIGFVGLLFLAALRDRIGLWIFLASLPLGALWGAYTLFMLGALQVVAGPVGFSAVLMGGAGFVGVLAPFAILRPSA